MFDGIRMSTRNRHQKIRRPTHQTILHSDPYCMAFWRISHRIFAGQATCSIRYVAKMIRFHRHDDGFRVTIFFSFFDIKFESRANHIFRHYIS